MGVPHSQTHTVLTSMGKPRSYQDCEVCGEIYLSQELRPIPQVANGTHITIYITTASHRARLGSVRRSRWHRQKKFNSVDNLAPTQYTFPTIKNFGTAIACRRFSDFVLSHSRFP